MYPKNVVLETPIQLINILRSDVDLMANGRNLIVLESSCKPKYWSVITPWTM